MSLTSPPSTVTAALTNATLSPDLIYSQSIFALEPSTVRVREVGVGRRARGERTRERAVPSDPDGAVSPTTPSLDRVFQPPDSPHGTSRLGGALADTIDSSGRASSTLPSLTPSAQSTPIPSPNFERQVNGNQGAVSSQTPSRRRTSARRQLYSTFTQLAFIPPLPSGLLSSQWTIPPLYSDVAAGSSDLSPLLSPVSLLSGAAVRNRTRPGLFFVSRGTSLTGIVTAEGKSSKLVLLTSARSLSKADARIVFASVQSSRSRSIGRLPAPPLSSNL